MNEKLEVPAPRAFQQLQVSDQTGRRLILTGRLVARQLPNGRWLVQRSSLDRCLAERRPVAA